METTKFKEIFSELAGLTGFKVKRDGWLKESPECIVTLDLQKSPFSKLYHLNIKIFIKDVFGNHYSADEQNLIKRGIGYLQSRGNPHGIGDPKDKSTFDLTIPMTDAERKQKLEKYFEDFLSEFIGKALSRKGLVELTEKGLLFMTDETKQKLINF